MVVKAKRNKEQELTLRQLFDYMEGCILLATTSPEGIRKPHVGAIVLSKEGDFVGWGYRKYLGGTERCLVHAERVALDMAGMRAEEGTLVTTLEPCVRMRTKGVFFRSCSELIVRSGIKRVVYGLNDNKTRRHYQDGGVGYLTEHGIEVVHFTRLNEKIIDELMSKRE